MYNLLFNSGYIEQLSCKIPEDFMTSSQASLIWSEHDIALICMPALCIWDSFFTPSHLEICPPYFT